MKTIWNEYGGILTGIIAAGTFTVLTVSVMISDGAVYEAVRMFAESIC